MLVRDQRLQPEIPAPGGPAVGVTYPAVLPPSADELCGAPSPARRRRRRRLGTAR